MPYEGGKDVEKPDVSGRLLVGDNDSASPRLLAFHICRNSVVDSLFYSRPILMLEAMFFEEPVDFAFLLNFLFSSS